MTDQHSDYSHQARKRFGQNFLVDPHVIDKIVSTIKPSVTDNIVEIGPGQGAITAPLLARAGKLQAVEVDRDLARLLREKFAANSGFVLHEGDALTFDFAALAQGGKLRVVGNLPYNISTPLIFHLLNVAVHIKDMHFMLQKEVVDRMAAEPGNKIYGRLSVIVQYYCQVMSVFDVPPSAFRPAPKVDSAIVRLIPRQHPIALDSPSFFQTLLRTAFQQRRKTLRNALKQLPGDWNMDMIDIDLSRRPETLAVGEFANLSNQLCSQMPSSP
ncbi:MAG: 16S rRNA (adenine(1518)-N(6)/adenine(1519)-N(6))-dimethyltransferase RsmA [Porticoccaceae bacterium]|nr:16S rRNA (adenine(1518)-N(6)/adenine(1519)-N(6))-dimethyltransferase RsmA [Porticoccaceae bacterium]